MLNTTLTEDECKLLLLDHPACPFEVCNRMVENCVGSYALPFGIATQFRVNGRDILVPMATEEPSVIAAASYAAKLSRPEGFTASGCEPLMIGQIQIVKVPDLLAAKLAIEEHEAELIQQANSDEKMCKSLASMGGGMKRLEVRILETLRGPMLIVHVVVNVKDSMGANVATKVAEGLAKSLEELSKGVVRLRILSNLSIYRQFTASAVWKKEDLARCAKRSGVEMDGEEIVEAILDAWAFAEACPFRAATNNKGIMNGITAVVTATGNDSRAVESCAHSFAAYNNQRYSTLTSYEKTLEGNIKGTITIPLPVGITGGATRTHAMSRLALKIINARDNTEFGMLLASVGLAQNFAALRALCTEGILSGHLRLHSSNVAILGGASGSVVEQVARKMADEGNVSASRARQLVNELCHMS